MKKINYCLSEESIETCLHHGSLITYRDGEVIHLRGDAAIGLSIVESGQVKVGNYGLDGNYKLTRVMTRGETFGEFTLFAALPRTHNAEAVGPTKVIQLTQHQYHLACETLPRIEKELLGLLAVKLHSCLETLDDITRLPLEVRLAKLLLALIYEQDTSHTTIEHNTDKLSEIKLNFTQSDLAELLSVTVLSTHKALKKLVDLHFISLHYGAVKITNITTLKDWITSHSSLHKL